ncbi:MAG TPA: hypothetical protein VLF39_03010 [Candidatus Saccharimonadales bacterium]|nr:hypothetical protein [Candidatus Saccharimonadales bacterium]
MPFEVYAVLGPLEIKSNTDERLITVNSYERVETDIADIYKRVAERGGQIITGYTLRRARPISVDSPEPDVLFLVADIPEQPSESPKPRD